MNELGKSICLEIAGSGRFQRFQGVKSMGCIDENVGVVLKDFEVTIYIVFNEYYIDLQVFFNRSMLCLEQ